MGYRTYDHQVKFLISKSGDPRLYPELCIPISTAKQWIKIKYHLRKNKIEFTVNGNHSRILKSEIKKLKEEIRECKRISKVQRHVYKKMEISPSAKSINSRLCREEIVKYIQENKGRTGVYNTLKEIDLSISRYKRWRKELYDSRKRIPPLEGYYQVHPRSLTKSEFNTLTELYTSPQYFHFPLHALVSYARKSNLLHCSPSTWRKYASLYKLKRPKTSEAKRNQYMVGITKYHPNQLWHIDVTEIKVGINKKFYLQVVIDNYSRYILAYRRTAIFLKTSSQVA